MATVHVQLPTGVILSAYNRDDGGPCTLIVAGQHGNETGPIEALAGFEPVRWIRSGNVAIIRLANPFGYALDHRYADANAGVGRRDLNRGWGTDPACVAMWTEACQALGRTPDHVIDLHSSRRPWSVPDPTYYDMGRMVMAADERALPFAEHLVQTHTEDGWRTIIRPGQDGTLASYAMRQGCSAISVEFDESISLDAPACGEPDAYSPQLKAIGLRCRSRFERTFGVRDMVKQALVYLHGSE